MASFRDDAQGVETVGVVQPQAPVQQPVSLNRDAVEHRRDRWNVFLRRCLNFPAGTKSRHGRREESHDCGRTNMMLSQLASDTSCRWIRGWIWSAGRCTKLLRRRSRVWTISRLPPHQRYGGLRRSEGGLPLAHGALRAPQFDLQSRGGIGAVSEVVVEVGDGVLWNPI